MDKVCIGIDLGGTTAKIGLLSVNGVILDKWEVPTRLEESGVHILPDIAASVLAYLEAHGIAHEQVAGAGIGVPGPVTPDGNVNVCVNLGWENVNPEQELSRLLGGIYAKAGNDANLAALGEMWQGGGKGYKNLMLFTLGTGVGGGVVIDEKVVAGFRGMGGEIGHIVVNFEEPDRCNCHNYGCLEQYASATGIVKEMKRALLREDTPSVLRDRASFSCKDVLDAAKAQDALALSLVDRCMRYLAIAMHYVTHITDPEIFVIGGGVSRAGQFLLDIIEAHYKKLTVMGKGRARLGLATLGNDAGMYGAARLILDRH